MNELQIFNNEEFGQVRTLEREGKVCFVGNDVAKALGYSIPSKAINTHCKGVSVAEVPTKGGKQQMIIITKEDVNILIQKSKVKSGKYKNDFKKWLVNLGLISDLFSIESRKEIEFLDLLEKVFEPFGYSCIRQKSVMNGKYRIDLYIEELKIAIEYDEYTHKQYTYEQQEYRQIEIIRNLDCKFIRVNDSESNAYNIGLVMKGIIEYGRF